MGSFEGGALRYRGRVGTGFGEREFAELAPRLAALAQEANPFEAVPPDARGARWVRPELAAEVSFAELTGEGVIRHGVYQGLREDKAVGEIRLERETAADDGKGPLVGGLRISSPERRVYDTPPVTKLQVAEHYAALAERILPFAAKRPLSLVRCPDGTGSACFFQKHRSPGMPKAIGGAIRDERMISDSDFCERSAIRDNA